MLKSKRDFDTCAKYSRYDSNGKVRCHECPLTRFDPDEPDMILCKAIAHYDRKLKRWVYDDD